MRWSKKIASLWFILCLLPITATVSAWEFSMDGAFYWEHELYSQLGPKGFFGSQDIDNSSQNTLYAPLNGWLGIQVAGDLLVTGTDAAATTQYMKINPQIKLNEAVRVRGNYYVGSWLTPRQPTSLGLLTRSEYFNSDASGVQKSFSPGYWRSLWLSARLPWGIFVVGKRPARFGVGMLYDGEDEFTSESTLLHVPYGPFRFGAYWYPWIRAYWDGPYPVLTDRNQQRTLVGSYGQYVSGYASLGVILDHSQDHLGPESQTTVNNRLAYQALDENLMNGVAYVKYNNGSVFLNTEAVYWIYSQRLSPSADGTQAGGSFYEDHWSGMVELGAIVRNAKLSLLWAYYPGPDRRHGILIDRQPFSPAASLNSGASIYRPYSLIMIYNYGTGNNSFTLSGRNGFVTDANVCAARCDLAIAANLNVFGTFVWAERLSHGYGWGYVRPDPNNYSQVEYAIQGTYNNPSPAIPDRDLGYEADLGFDWKWLEGYTLGGTFGVWQPGRWFNFACVDRSVPNWDNPTAANNFGINPSRTIQPVFGMQVLLKAEF